MMIVLRIRTDGSGEELARVLRSLAQQVEGHDMRAGWSWIEDSDGNRCGTLQVVG